MKKFIRYLRLKHRSPSDPDEHVKKRQRYEVDYTLEPFAGLTPEYMEMSEWGRGRPGARCSPHTVQEARASCLTCSCVPGQEEAQQGHMVPGVGQGREGTGQVEPPDLTSYRSLCSGRISLLAGPRMHRPRASHRAFAPAAPGDLHPSLSPWRECPLRSECPPPEGSSRPQRFRGAAPHPLCASPHG